MRIGYEPRLGDELKSLVIKVTTYPLTAGDLDMLIVKRPDISS